MTPGSASVKASNLRKKLRGDPVKGVAPRELTPTQQAWLTEYEAGVASRKNAPRSQATTQATSQATTHATHVHTPAYEPPSQVHHSGGYQVLDFGASQETNDALATQSNGCDIEDCPMCKNTAGSKLCVTTGKRVWPKVTENESLGMAGTLAGGLAMGAKYLRKDKTMVLVTMEQRKQLATAIRETAHKRANWVGAVADIFALLFAIGAIVKHVMTAEPPTPAPPRLSLINGGGNSNAPAQ